MTATFTAYLRRQTRRRDPVGDIARESNDDPDWPDHVQTIEGLHRYLKTHGVPEAAHEALDTAWDEYQTSSKRRGSR